MDVLLYGFVVEGVAEPIKIAVEGTSRVGVQGDHFQLTKDGKKLGQFRKDKLLAWYCEAVRSKV